MLKIKFVGAVEGVSGSCTWVHHTNSDTQFLVDCGMYQGSDSETWFNQQDFPFQAKALKFVLLTHAHMDHCGLLPRLVKEGFSGQVFATEATKALALVMLGDAVRVNKAFTQDDIEKIKWRLLDADEGFKWGRSTRLAQDLWMSCLRSSHILGACAINVSWMCDDDKKTICFSGDVGCQTEENAYLPLLKEGHSPFPGSDYVVVESTYGGRIRDDQFKCTDKRLEQLQAAIEHTRQKGGKVLIPSFTLHRMQELMMDLLCLMKAQQQADGAQQRPLCALVHSPLGQAVTKVYADTLLSRSPNGKFKYFKQGLCERMGLSPDALQALLANLVNHGECPKESEVNLFMHMPKLHPKAINRVDADVVVASAGMCENGPVVEYLEKWGTDPRNTIILTGHQAKGSQGAQLMERASTECRNLAKLPNNQAEVIDMSGYYSAHADQSQLLDYLFNIPEQMLKKDSTVFINHGDRHSKMDLKAAIEARGALAANGDRSIKRVRLADKLWVNLDTGMSIE